MLFRTTVAFISPLPWKTGVQFLCECLVGMLSLALVNWALLFLKILMIWWECKEPRYIAEKCRVFQTLMWSDGKERFY